VYRYKRKERIRSCLGAAVKATGREMQENYSWGKSGWNNK